MEGNGIFYYKDGDKYEGEFKKRWNGWKRNFLLF
jgi:hypothetical protein